MEDGSIGICGHMIDPQSFPSFQLLQDSTYLRNLQSKDLFPPECARCKQEEDLGYKSIRQHAIEKHKFLSKMDNEYLIVGGILDNICNSACQFCSENLSTKIGNLKHGKNYFTINNYEKFFEFPQDKIVELDINGGEPSNSRNYKKLLENLPPNLKILRINTNCSKFIENIDKILKNKIKVIVTISLDGTERIYEYARYPLKWNTFNKVLKQYIDLRKNNSLLELNFWSTLSAYTIGDLDKMKSFAKDKDVKISFGILHEPEELNIKYLNPLTLSAKSKISQSDNLFDLIASDYDNSKELYAYITEQDKIRRTNYENCYNWT
jgi:molybdenum cofactor biosynthesis enzyme MoaA